MKRLIIVISLFCIANGIYANDDVRKFLSPYENIKKQITHTSSQVYGGENIFSKPLNRANIIEWKKTISKIQDFIMHHTHDPKFLAHYRNIKRIEIELTKNAVQTYESFFKHHTPLNSTQINRIKKPFITMQSQAENIQKAVKNITVKNQDQGRVRDVIGLFAFTIAFIAKKIISDIDKKVGTSAH